MSLRITNTMLVNQSVTDITNNNERIAKVEQQISTGRSILQPSDDPAGLARAMVLQNNLDANTQYQKNVAAAKNFMAVTDSTLTDVVNALQQLRQLAVQGANGDMDSNDKQAIATQVTQIRAELQAMGNTQVDGRYIFGGLKTDQQVYPPDLSGPGLFPGNGVTFGPNDNGSLQVEISPGELVSYNTTAVAIFGNTTPGNTNNVFSVIDTLNGYLTGTNPATGLPNPANPAVPDAGLSSEAISNVSIAQIDTWIRNVTNVQTNVGAQEAAMDLAANRMTDFSNSLQTLLDSTQDTDIAKASLQLNQYQATLQASLSVGARALPMSLVDYLH